MSIEIKCSGCGQILRVQDQDAGKQARCPKCKTTFAIPPSEPSGAGPTFGGVEPKPEPFGQQEQAPYGQPTQPPFGQQGQNPFSDKPQVPTQNPYAPPQQNYPQVSGGSRYRRPHRGGTILTLGILAILCNFCFIPGICAWSMGNNDLNAMRRGQMDPSGRGLTQAGHILGIIGTILSAILGILQVVLRGDATVDMRSQYPMIGAHMSISGGYHKAVESSAEFGMDVVQIFTKNNNQWRAKPITDEESERFGESLSKLNISHPLSHASYLINLASPDAALRTKSINAFVVELQRADQLGIPYVVLHPGSFTTSSEEAGLKTIIQSLDEVHHQTPKVKSQCLLENTAGQGSNLGWQFEQLATILDGVQHPDRLGICFDTCHAFAAGYPLSDEKDYKKTMKQLNTLVGIDRVHAIHLNDSKREFGSRVDRHEHIGKGEIGLESFRNLLNDRRFRKTPMYLETPKDEHDGRAWDAINLETLQDLVE